MCTCTHYYAVLDGLLRVAVLHGRFLPFEHVPEQLGAVIYVYIYIYTHIYICTYIYIYRYMIYPRGRILRE